MTATNILFLCNGADFCFQIPIALYRDTINVYVLLIGMSNLTIENDTDKKNASRIDHEFRFVHELRIDSSCITV